MESFRNACNRFVSIMHSSGMQHRQISKHYQLYAEIASYWNTYQQYHIYKNFILHNLSYIPAYTHIIPTGVPFKKEER